MARKTVDERADMIIATFTENHPSLAKLLAGDETRTEQLVASAQQEGDRIISGLSALDLLAESDDRANDTYGFASPVSHDGLRHAVITPRGPVLDTDGE